MADSAAPIRDRDGHVVGVVIVFRDVTAETRMQAEIQRAAKLESIGVLAGGIAHDFNNLLGGIFGYIDLARMETSSENRDNCLASALAAIDRARSLTHQLLTFAKGGAPIKKIEKFMPFIQETAQFALSGSPVSCRRRARARLIADALS